MLSNFCFMNFFGQSANNGLIDVRKTSSDLRGLPRSSAIWPQIKKWCYIKSV